MDQFHFEFQGKSARVTLNPLPPARPKLHMSQKTSVGAVSRMRVLNGINPTIDPSKLTSAEVMKEDKEIVPEQAGRKLDVELTAAYFDPSEETPKPIGNFKEIDVIYDPEGNEKERRPHLIRSTNLNTLHPIKVGKRFPIKDALTQFVFKNTFQLVHQDGLTMEFLHQLAKDLHEKQEVAFLGAGPKGNQPLVVKEKGNPFRAFLYGEINKSAPDEYKLIVLLSDQELKSVKREEPKA